MLIAVSAKRTERIREAEFDRNPGVEEGWEVIARKGGYVYIGFNRELAQKLQTERLARVTAAAKQVK